ncbi:MAG: CD225/dispanin family protein, partial [Isosphaeraceae bacterium]
MRNDVGPSKNPEIPNYLGWAIASTVLCCPSFRIVAIVQSAKVNGKLASGGYAGAVEVSRNPTLWVWVTFITGLGFTITTVIMIFVVRHSLDAQAQ